MSVAFRRESDEEHLEPKFELPIPPGPNLVTERGLALIQGRHDTLEARLNDDLTEDERKAVLRDLRYWRQRLATAQIAHAPDGQRVAFGTRVTFLRDGQSHSIDIVGHDEGEPAANRVSFAAPLARALIGAEVGDEVSFAGADKPLLITAISVAP